MTTKRTPEQQAAISKAVAAKIARTKVAAAGEEILARPYGKTDAEIAKAAAAATIDVPADVRGKTIAQMVAQAKAKRDKVAAIKADAKKTAIKKQMVAKWVQAKKDHAVAERIAAGVAAKYAA